MTPLTPLLLVAGMLLMLGSLAWIGWRFFLAAPVESDPAPARQPFRWPRLRMPQLHLPSLPPGALRWLLLPLLLAGTVITWVLLLGRRVELAPLEATPLAHENRVRTELNPERLVPPPPLPPSFFVVPDRTDLLTADRDWSKLDPGFTQVVLQLFARMQKLGYPMVLLEGYRSPERQDHLASIGTHVTHARGGQSRHQVGLAADLAFSREGRLVISEKDPWAAVGYELLGQEAEALGLTWGGRWAMRDLGHLESRTKRHTRRHTADAIEVPA